MLFISAMRECHLPSRYLFFEPLPTSTGLLFCWFASWVSPPCLGAHQEGRLRIIFTQALVHSPYCCHQLPVTRTLLRDFLAGLLLHSSKACWQWLNITQGKCFRAENRVSWFLFSPRIVWLAGSRWLQWSYHKHLIFYLTKTQKFPLPGLNYNYFFIF